MYNLTDKVVLVTGAGRRNGIGEAVVWRFITEGCRVVISDIGSAKGTSFSNDHIGTTDDMNRLVEAIAAQGGQAIGIACDVRFENEVEHLFARTIETFGRIDILINNAGVGYLMEAVTNVSESDWDAVLDTNLKGTFLCTKHAARHMIRQGQGGSIINIASQAAKSGFPFAAAYTASKHGVLGLTRSNAVELGQYGIRVNAVCPNHITTGLGHWQNQYFSNKLGLSYDDYLQSIKDRNPLGRTGLVEDVAKTCAFLASDQAAYITGEAMNVSGGEEYH
ncbi:MAG: SDR family oxidoreductase [Saprospiraceae bacterium]|nr:SDR family oxidoreductase [Saprospiraceae bacterium]